MTRKRFIKLCMANGMQRNEANEKAKKVCMYGSYELMYRKLNVYLRMMHMKTDLDRIYRQTMNTIRSVVNQHMLMIAATCEGVSDILKKAAEIRDTPYFGDQELKMAVDWFQMSNNDFYNTYGFNFNPHEYPGLYEVAREIVYGGE